jgi:low temperature requirement protein LtrA
MTTTTEHSSSPPKRYKALQRMTGRSPHESHRVATTLELFFDLIFVVAIAFAGAQLHHAITENHISHGVLSYLMVFFAIWCAWMNFTWFASSFDTDDVPYRVAVFVQMAGALIIAAGVPTAFEGNWVLLTVGYVVMRLASITQWLRAANQAPEHRQTALRYALGVFLAQIGWILILFLPKQWGVLSFLVMVLFEFAVPMWAESAGMTSWNPHHIAERYGLLTLIVLGESILAAVNAVQKVASTSTMDMSLIAFCIGALLIVFCMWWIYFEDEAAEFLRDYKVAFYWGYGHYFIFAAAAAVGAGLAAQLDFRMGTSQASTLAIGYALALPVAVFIFALWLIHKRVSQAQGTWVYPLATLLILMVPWISGSNTLQMGLVLVGAIGLRLILCHTQQKA